MRADTYNNIDLNMSMLLFASYKVLSEVSGVGSRNNAFSNYKLILCKCKRVGMACPPVRRSHSGSSNANTPILVFTCRFAKSLRCHCPSQVSIFETFHLTTTTHS